MPITTSAIRAQYPYSPSNVEAGQLGRAIAERDRALEAFAAVNRETQAWEERLRTIDVLISRATPDSDMVQLAAATVEQGVLRRALQLRLPAVTSAQQSMRNAMAAAEQLANEYLAALDTVEGVERGTGYREDAERARQRLVALAGPPSA
jgi:hypothetical protein